MITDYQWESQILDLNWFDIICNETADYKSETANFENAVN